LYGSEPPREGMPVVAHPRRLEPRGLNDPVILGCQLGWGPMLPQALPRMNFNVSPRTRHPDQDPGQDPDPDPDQDPDPDPSQDPGQRPGP